MISNCGHDENGKYSGGQAGDQTGTEWQIINWYSRPWNVVLRHPDRDVGDYISELAIEAANNNLIGYDQNERTTFWAALAASGYYPKNITTACEADCSAGVAAIVKATGYLKGLTALQNVSKDAYTGNLRNALVNAGFEALTDSKYLTSDQYLYNGDILLYEGHHTAVNVSDGSKVSRKTNTETKGGNTANMAITGMDLRKACLAVCNTARTSGWKYGDSQATPPCSDGKISCDRMIARALYNLGYTNQPKGGITVLNMEKYLTSWGFKKITDASKLTHGDIVLMKANGTSAPTAAWHTFLCDQFWGTSKIWKYDCGSQARIQVAQPFQNVPLNEWNGSKTFYCGFRAPGEGISDSGSSSTTTVIKPNGKDAGVESGIYTIHSALDNNYVLDITNGSLDDKANVQLYPSNGSLAQRFFISPTGSEGYLIGNVQSGKMLDVQSGSTASGANIQQYKSNGTKSQRVWIQDAGSGYVHIYFQVSGLALDNYGCLVKKGNNIQQYTPNESNAQKWLLKKI